MSTPRTRTAILGALEERLGHRFARRELLEAALTHRSHVHESADPGLPSYERLEFLGDALLGFVVSELLYRDDPQADEGRLTRRRQAVVRTETLAGIARELGLGAALRLGRGEERTGGRERPSLLADAFEAVVAAVFVDAGIRTARACIRRHLGASARVSAREAHHGPDAKTRLQELLQARLHRTPGYRIVSRTGPEHEAQFVVEVRVGSDVLGRGAGSNRKRAEQAAAHDALARLAGAEG